MNRQERAEFARRLIARFGELKDDEGWTQQTLAQASGAKLRTVSDVLRGVSVPNERTSRQLADAMGIPVESNAKWARYADFFNVLGMYLAARPDEEEAIKARVLRALFAADPEGSTSRNGSSG